MQHDPHKSNPDTSHQENSNPDTSSQDTSHDDGLTPAQRAAWKGYREYKQDMENRVHMPTLKTLNVKTLLVIAIVIFIMMMVRDLSDYVFTALE
jgi:hypothetical protein